MNDKIRPTSDFNILSKGGAHGVSRDVLISMVRYLARREAEADYRALLEREKDAIVSDAADPPESEPEP